MMQPALDNLRKGVHHKTRAEQTAGYRRQEDGVTEAGDRDDDSDLELDEDEMRTTDPHVSSG
jgi:hypothetical protein